MKYIWLNGRSTFVSMYVMDSPRLMEIIRLYALASGQSADSFLSCHKGNGGDASGRIAMDRSSVVLSSAATGSDDKVPQDRQR